MTYDIEPAEEVEVTKSLGEDLLAAADETVVQQIREAPKAPDKPFLTGVYSYPFRLKIFPMLIGMVLGWTIVLVLVRLALILPFVIPAAAILGMMVLLPTLVTFQKIVENTSNADEESECRPEGGLLAFIDWAGEVIPIALAIFLSGLPAFLVVKAAQLRPEFIATVPVLSYLLFPLFYVSMLESASVGGMFSKPVWGSLTKLPGTWLKFYSITGLLLVIGLGAIGGVTYWRMQQSTAPPILNMVGAVAGVVAVNLVLLTIYFRLVGRVAFVLSQKIMIEDEDAAVEERTEFNSHMDAEVSIGG